VVHALPPLENKAVTNPLFLPVYRRRLPGAIETSYLLPRSIYHTQLVFMAVSKSAKGSYTFS
jgi:hypothetical protein